MLKYGTIALFVVLLIALSDHTLAQTRIVQGKILRNYKQAERPFASIPVTLYKPSNKKRSNPSITDVNGNYYFYNMPAGTYQLEIWIYGNVNQKNRSRARIHRVVISYQKAVTRGKRELLRLSPIRVKMK